MDTNRKLWGDTWNTKLMGVRCYQRGGYKALEEVPSYQQGNLTATSHSAHVQHLPLSPWHGGYILPWGGGKPS